MFEFHGDGALLEKKVRYSREEECLDSNDIFEWCRSLMSIKNLTRCATVMPWQDGIRAALNETTQTERVTRQYVFVTTKSE